MNEPPIAGSPTIEKLSPAHDLSGFECGQPSLDEWLRRYALANQRNDSAQTYVALVHRAVAGYYSLAAGSVAREESPERIVKGLARHPVPFALLARLAVHRSAQGSGLGKALLKDALIRCAGSADSIGVRAVLVHAIDEAARRFYGHFGFEASPVDPFHLMLLMKDLRAAQRSG